MSSLIHSTDGWDIQHFRSNKQIKKKFYLNYLSLIRTFGWRRKYFRSDKQIKKVFYLHYLSLIRTFAGMKRLFVYFVILLAAFITVSCHHHSDEPNKKKRETVERTVIVYMAAENSLSRVCRYDSLEMVQGISHVTEDYNLILYKDDDKLPVIYQMSQKDGVQTWRSYTTDQTSTDSLVMLSTLKDIINEFPARHYGLVLWSHASGWVPAMEGSNRMANESGSNVRRRTFGVDNNQNVNTTNKGLEMEISALRWTLEQLPHLDYILFDACFMQNIEVAYELRNVADYLIGSPAEIPINGAPYAHIMEPMMKGDAIGIAEEYYQYYQSGTGIALSVIDCLEMEAFARKTATCLPAIYNNGSEIDLTGIHNYVPFTSDYKWRPYAYDMKGFMHKHLDEDMYEDWLQVLNRAVPFQKATSYWDSIFFGTHNRLSAAEDYSGIAMFLPDDIYERLTYNWNLYFKNTSWYKASGWNQVYW